MIPEKRFGVRVRTQEESRRVQQTFFDNGFMWMGPHQDILAAPVRDYGDRAVIARWDPDKIVYGEVQNFVRNYRDVPVFSVEEFLIRINQRMIIPVEVA